MSKAGQNNFKGITYQAQAALLLFLLRLKENGFESITLEDSHWEDFTLNYRTGKKVISEAKNHSRSLGVSEVRSILQNILDHKDVVNEKDEVIIISPKIVDDLDINFEYINYFSQIAKKYRDLGFSDKQLELLAKTSFFIAESSDFLYQEASAYLYSYIGYWLPQSEIDGLINTVLVNQIYEKSTKGETFTRSELADAIEKYRKEKIQSNGVYDSEQTSIEYQMKTVLDDINKQNTIAIKRDLTALTAQPQKMFIVIEKVTSLPGVKLADWDFLWEALLDRQYAFRVLHNFEDKHIQDTDNAAYILWLITNHINSLTKKTVDRYHAEFALELAQKILDLHPELEGDILDFINAFLKERGHSYFELEDKTGSSHEKQLIAGLIFKLFNFYLTNGNQEKTKELLGLVDSHFSLVEDDGNLKFFIYTPSPIFDLLRDYILADYDTNFPVVKSMFVNQFKKAKYYGDKFKGWELMGGTFSQMGDEYSLGDRHFIARTLKPVLARLYEDDPVLTWNRILTDWVTSKQGDIKEDRPDFLNRATIDILLTEYAGDQNSENAFEILRAFILMSKGIPAKFECVYQVVRSSESISEDKKWKLVKIFLDKYGLPQSVFIEQIVSDLALSGNLDALQAMKAWVSNPEYRKQQNRRSFLLGENMLKLLDAPVGSDAYKTGVEILKLYINTSDYRQDLGTFDAYNITDSIAAIIKKDIEAGVQLLWDIYNSSKSLSKNQQIALLFPLTKLDSTEVLEDMYSRFVEPIIIDELQADNGFIEAKFTDNYARELLVQFAEKMAEARLFDLALNLVRIFINDSNPKLENESNDPKGDFNYHEKIKAGGDNITINTVRGWCAWALTKFNIADAHKFQQDAVDLVEVLSRDPNLYIRVQATFPLSGLARNRHTVLPKNSKKRFMSLKLAERVEDIAFNMLKDKDNQKYLSVLKHLAPTFTYIRSLTEKQALEVLNIYRTVPFGDDIDDIYPLFIFFALFRKDAFKGKRYKEIYGAKLYNEIQKFDDTKFKEILENLIRNGTQDTRRRIAWQFWKLPKENPHKDFEDMFALSIKYLTMFTESYDKHTFDNIFYFINDNLDRKPHECIELWRSCIKEEKNYLEKHKDTLQSYEWWPNHFNQAVLTKTKEVLGDEEFLKSFEILLSYPDGFDIGVDIHLSYSHLKELADSGNKKAQKLKKRLMEIYPQLYDQ